VTGRTLPSFLGVAPITSSSLYNLLGTIEEHRDPQDSMTMCALSNCVRARDYAHYFVELLFLYLRLGGIDFSARRIKRCDG
jgi:hypothetical protein